MVYHPAGTCKMGTSENANGNMQLDVIGIESLRVVDTSIMPQLNSWNGAYP